MSSESTIQMFLRHENEMLKDYQMFKDNWLSLAASSRLQSKICLALFVPCGGAAFYHPMAIIFAFFILLWAAEGQDAYKRRMKFAHEFTDKIMASKHTISKLESLRDAQAVEQPSAG